MDFKKIQEVNESIITTDVKGKQYAEVNQRIKAFRMLYPQGTIESEIVSLKDGVCVMKAYIYANAIATIKDDGSIKIDKMLLGTGTAYEKENSTFINKTSYIENCETSAVGRALAMCGIGIDTSIASAEEVQNAINNQETCSKEEALNHLFKSGKHANETIKEIYEAGDIEYLQDLLDNAKVNPQLKEKIKIATGLEPRPEPSEKEQTEILFLTNEINELLSKVEEPDKVLKGRKTKGMGLADLIILKNELEKEVK